MKISKLKTEQISTRVLYVLVGLIAVVFALFYLVGYNMPYLFDPAYNAPMLTDAVLCLMYLMLVAGVGVAVYSVAKGSKTRNAEKVVNGVPVAKIAWGTAASVAALLVLTFVCGSSSPVKVNGTTFADAFWLRLTDMFIYTSLILIVAAVVAVGYSMSGVNRRRK